MSLIKKLVLVFWLTDLSVSVVWAGTTQPAGSTNPDGAKIYLDNCSICHGDKGDADTRVRGSLQPPPRDFTTTTAAKELTRERMIESVSNGRPGTGMVAHKDRLSAAEISAVVDYIRAQFMHFAPETVVASQPVTADAEGGKIYAKNCAVCHGDKGSTAFWARSGLNPPPRDFTSEQARQELSRERMISSVTNGRPGTAMMPHKDRLSATQIEHVVDYIRASFMSGPVANAAESAAPQPTSPMHPGMPSTSSSSQAHLQMPGFGMPGTANPSLNITPVNPHQTVNPHQGLPMGAMPGTPASGAAASADMAVAMPKGLKGNIQQGRAFYMSNCFTCHGVKGDGNGPRAYFNIPRPRDFTSEDSRRVLNRERLFHSISNGRVGTVMPAWGKVLNDQQIANVAEFVFTAFIHVKPQSAGKKKAQ